MLPIMQKNWNLNPALESSKNAYATSVGKPNWTTLEEFEMQQDIQAYREAKAEDDGERLSLAEVRGQMNL